MRHGPDELGSSLLSPFHHAVPYLFLGYRYIFTGNIQVTQKKFVLPLVIYLSAVLLSGVQMFHSEYIENDFLIVAMTSVFTSIILSHYTFDMFLWSRTHNPGWIRALSNNKMEEREILKSDGEKIKLAA
jgi:hypothetical protein